MAATSPDNSPTSLSMRQVLDLTIDICQGAVLVLPVDQLDEMTPMQIRSPYPIRKLERSLHQTCNGPMPTGKQEYCFAYLMKNVCDSFCITLEQPLGRVLYSL
jgi:hypothetical protein